jgi:hypothetical protein
MRAASWNADPEPERPRGLFHDALAGWANDDVL